MPRVSPAICANKQEDVLGTNRASQLRAVRSCFSLGLWSEERKTAYAKTTVGQAAAVGKVFQHATMKILDSGGVGPGPALKDRAG